jgi:release factor glutamine methyltransferase
MNEHAKLWDRRRVQYNRDCIVQPFSSVAEAPLKAFSLSEASGLNSCVHTTRVGFMMSDEGRAADAKAAVPCCEWEVVDPDMSHASKDDYWDVYEPREDTYLMMDALTEDRWWLHARLGVHEKQQQQGPCVAMEVGCGSGMVISFLSGLLGHRALCVATDVNPKACALARTTMKRHGVRVGEVLQTNLADAWQGKEGGGMVDVLVYNPPYVATPHEETLGDGISRSWAGGVRGREMLDPLLLDVGRVLSPRGVFYLVVAPVNDPADIINIMKGEGFVHTVVASQGKRLEQLEIVRFIRKT